MLDAAELKPTFGVDPNRYVARLAGGSQAFSIAAEGAEDDREAGAAAAADLSPMDVAFGVAALPVNPTPDRLQPIGVQFSFRWRYLERSFFLQPRKR